MIAALYALFWIAVTVGLYGASDWLYRRCGHRAFVHPVLLPVVVLIVIFEASDLDSAKYLASTQILSTFLAAAVVGLAVPLYRSFHALKENRMAVMVAIAGGSASGVISALVPAWLLHAPEGLIASLLTKSITTPIAVTVAQSVGGIPAVAAAVVIVTGLVAALVGPWLLRFVGVDDPVATGVALGTAGHAIGTAEAVRRSDVMGSAAAFAMIINGLATAVLLPLIAAVVG